MGRSFVVEEDNRLTFAITFILLLVIVHLLSFVSGKSIVVWIRMLHNESYNR
jgi:hypothetical protein